MATASNVRAQQTQGNQYTKTINTAQALGDSYSAVAGDTILIDTLPTHTSRGPAGKTTVPKSDHGVSYSGNKDLTSRRFEIKLPASPSSGDTIIVNAGTSGQSDGVTITSTAHQLEGCNFSGFLNAGLAGAPTAHANMMQYSREVPYENLYSLHIPPDTGDVEIKFFAPILPSWMSASQSTLSSIGLGMWKFNTVTNVGDVDFRRLRLTDADLLSLGSPLVNTTGPRDSSAQLQTTQESYMPFGGTVTTQPAGTTQTGDQGITLKLVDGMPGWWLQPNCYNALDVNRSAERFDWCLPTAAAQWLGYVMNPIGMGSADPLTFNTVPGFDIAWPDSEYPGDVWYHNYQWEEGARPGRATYAQENNNLSDFGWYFNTNDLGSNDNTLRAFPGGSAKKGTLAWNSLIGLKEWLRQAGVMNVDSGQGVVSFFYNQESINYANSNASEPEQGPLAGTGTTYADFFAQIFNMIDQNIPVIAHFQRWTLRQDSTTFAKSHFNNNRILPPETTNTGKLTDFAIQDYYFDLNQGTSPDIDGSQDHGINESYEGSTDTCGQIVGHSVLVVGYMRIPSTYTKQGTLTDDSAEENPIASISALPDGKQPYYYNVATTDTDFLLVLDDNNSNYASTGVAGPNTGVDKRTIKAVPIKREGNYTIAAEAGGSILGSATVPHWIDFTF